MSILEMKKSLSTTVSKFKYVSTCSAGDKYLLKTLCWSPTVRRTVVCDVLISFDLLQKKKKYLKLLFIKKEPGNLRKKHRKYYYIGYFTPFVSI